MFPFYQGVIGSGHFCSERGFPSIVQELARNLVPCTRRLWQLTKVLTLLLLLFYSVVGSFVRSLQSSSTIWFNFNYLVLLNTDITPFLTVMQ